MSNTHIFALAVALAMDAFAVAVATGVTLKTVSARQTFRLAWHFGLFQAMMPVLGWFCGAHLLEYIDRYGHWIAFCLLTFVGGKMLAEAYEDDNDGAEDPRDPTRSVTLVVLSVATSIDALAIGFTLSVLHVAIAWPALVIGLVAGAFTVAGLHMGAKLGSMSRIGHVAEILGGIVLIAIGVRILWEHKVFSF